MRLLCLTFFLIILTSLRAPNGYESNSSRDGEQAYINGQIYTVNPKQPWAEAMLIRDGIIVLIGTNKLIQEASSSATHFFDLKHRMVMPGIHDVHMHPLEAASNNFQFELSTSATNPEKYAYDIEVAIDENPKSPWVLGWGFDIHTLLSGKRAPIEILDDISDSKPIAIMEKTSHAIWVNSKALELAGIDAESTNPIGGIIMKSSNGKPNGLLIDNAGNLLMDLAIRSIPNSEQNDYDGLVNFALPTLAEHGITSICDARTYWKRNHHLIWQRVRDEKKLTARVNLALWLYPTEQDTSQMEDLKSLYSYDQNSLLKINQIKLYIDGIIINTTSAMHDDFKIDIFNQPTNNGINYVNQSRLTQYISVLEPFGFDFHIHAIGNRGVHETLNAIEESGTKKGRHRITHLEFVSPQDYSRFNRLNVTADAQVAGDFSQPQYWKENDAFVDAALNTNVIPIKSLLEADARVTLSSDWDVSTLNPFVGIEHAITRFPESLSLEQAIRAYTINAAYVMRQEDKVGSLEVGKEADFIVLSQHLFEVKPNKVSRTKVLNTFFQGREIYTK